MRCFCLLVAILTAGCLTVVPLQDGDTPSPNPSESATPTPPSDWFGDYEYRIPFTVTAGDDLLPAGHSIQVVLPTIDSLRADGEDVRITHTTDGMFWEELHRFLDPDSQFGNAAVFWIPLARDIPANLEDAGYYMYIGDVSPPDAALADPRMVFEIYEDFENASLNELSPPWTFQQASVGEFVEKNNDAFEGASCVQFRSADLGGDEEPYMQRAETFMSRRFTFWAKAPVPGNGGGLFFKAFQSVAGDGTVQGDGLTLDLRPNLAVEADTSMTLNYSVGTLSSNTYTRVDVFVDLGPDLLEVAFGGVTTFSLGGAGFSNSDFQQVRLGYDELGTQVVEFRVDSYWERAGFIEPSVVRGPKEARP